MIPTSAPPTLLDQNRLKRRVVTPPPEPPRVDNLASREGGLWRLALLVLMVLALGLAVMAWTQVREKSPEWMVLPAGLLVLTGLFCFYVMAKTSEIKELRGLVRGLEQRVAAPPDENQLEKLFGMVERSQQGYRDLIDTFEDLLFSLSTTGQILAANRSFAALLGHPFSELMGRRLDEFVDVAEGTSREVLEKALPLLLERRQWFGVLYIRLKCDNRARFFQCTVQALVRDGQDRGFCVLARDITAEREREARFTELFETLQEGVYLATADGKFENVNPAMVRLLGYDRREELLNRSLSEFLLHPGDWQAEWQQLAEVGATKNHEIVLRRKDGAAITCLHAAALIRDTSGRVRRHQGTLMDITESRAMQLRLHREQEFARRLVESFPDLVVAVDRQNRCTFASPRVKELWGFEPEEIVGTPLGQRMDPQDRREVHAMLDEILAGRRSVGNVEFLTERRDGEMRSFRATASPLCDASGQIQGVIASARDITESKRMEQQLIQTERLAAMGQMIAGVAHELNNPLTAVLGVTELLRDSATDDSHRRQLDLAYRQSRRAAQIVQSLLSFSRPPQPRKLCVHISDIIQRSLQLHEHSLRNNRIAVDFIPRPELPAVLGDASQLTQVFLNLITNAEQAILEVRDHGTLRIRVAALGEQVVATFQDDGVGIRREILPKLFDPFFTTKRPGRGTGLGLSICLAILREHNGQIEAQPLSDGGAVFTVTLPVATLADTILIPTSGALMTEPPPAVNDRLAGCRVLVVDDEEGIRELVRDGLGVRGVRVDDVSTAEDAVIRLTSNPYDAVLCDLNLSNGSGAAPGAVATGAALTSRELLTRINAGEFAQANPQKPFFMFMTGELVDRDVMDELSNGGTRTLQKPFRISELISVLTDVVARVPVKTPAGPSD